MAKVVIQVSSFVGFIYFLGS